MENWASDPAVLKTYALHYELGEPIPQALIDKLQKARHFNQGFMTVEYLAASFLDMDWHVLTEATEPDAAAFEKATQRKNIASVVVDEKNLAADQIVIGAVEPRQQLLLLGRQLGNHAVKEYGRLVQEPLRRLDAFYNHGPGQMADLQILVA